MPQKYAFSSKPPRKKKEFCKLSANYPISVIYKPIIIIRKTKCFRPAKRNVQKEKRNVFVLDTLPNHIKNSVRTAFLPNSNAISISTYQCLSYHNLKALHVGELQAAIFRCLEQLLLVNVLDGYLYLGIGKV